MSVIKEIKENQTVVKGVGDFAGSLQQIAAGRMVRLRNQVLAAKRFGDEAVIILRELELERAKQIKTELAMEKNQLSVPKKPVGKTSPNSARTAIIIITADQGLCGSYNTEIFQKTEEVAKTYQLADYFVIGRKGQEFFVRLAKKYDLRYYPYYVPETVTLEDLRPLIMMFYRYDRIFVIYNRYINTAVREPVFLELAVPVIENQEAVKAKTEGTFIFEPNLDDLIAAVTHRLRYALFRQQILDSKLSLYTAQMIAMQTAAENAKDLLSDLKKQFNKARRKLIDKKIQEVQAGRSLWATE
jgi:F-type H+-transporting ATPase subunit gamma